MAIGHQQLADLPQQEFGYSLEFSDMRQYDQFVAEAKARGLQSEYFTAPRQSKLRELPSPLGWLKVITRPNGSGGPTWGTTYDLTTGCPQCGTGARQVSALVLRPEDAPARSNVWQTLDGEVLLSAELSRGLKAATGLELRQAVSLDDETPLPWFQVIPRHELPRMAPTTVGIYQSTGSPTAPCSRCQRDGFFTRFQYTIRYELDLSKVPAFSHTFEHFGRSGLRKPFVKSHFAQPLLIIRSSVYHQLLAGGAAGITAEPIEVTDYQRPGKPKLPD